MNKNELFDELGIVGNREILQSIVSALSGTYRERNYNIYGEPQFGKSFLLESIGNLFSVDKTGKNEEITELQYSWLPLSIDLNLLPTNDEINFWKYIFYKLAIKARELNCLSDSMRSLQEEVKTSSDMYVVQTSLEDFLSELKNNYNKGLLLLLDNFDVFVNNFEPEVVSRTSAKFVALHESLKDLISYIVASRDRLDILFDEKEGIDRGRWSEFPRILSYQILEPFNKKDAFSLISKELSYLEQDLKNISDYQEFIYNCVDGHPSLIKQMCLYINQNLEKKHLSDKSKSSLEKSFRKDPSIQLLLSMLWERLEPSKDRGSNLRKSLLDLVKNNKQTDNKSLEQLRSRGWVVKDKEGYKIAGIVFHNFIVEDLLTEKKTEYQSANENKLKGTKTEFEFDIDTKNKQILFKNRVVSLTPKEFALFDYLSAHSNKVCSRGEISQSMWGEDYTNINYKDALEQIISRVRQKIEANPETPRIILSIRGRGYMLRNINSKD